MCLAAHSGAPLFVTHIRTPTTDPAACCPLFRTTSLPVSASPLTFPANHPNYSPIGPCASSVPRTLSTPSPHSPRHTCGARVLQGTLQLRVSGGPLATSLPAGPTMSSASSTPSIRVYESHRYSLPHHHRPSHPSPAVAMAIPRAREEVPPPLPPPRHIEDLRAGQDSGWQWGNTNSPKDTGFSGSRLAIVRPGSSLYGVSGSGHSRPRQPSTDYVFKGRESSISRSLDDMSSENSADHNSDEERGGKSRPSLGHHR